MTQGMIIGDEGHILLHVQDGQPVGEMDPVVAGWFERGVPSLQGVDTDGVISEQSIVVPPNDPFFLLALMEEAERRDWTVVDEAGPEQKSDLLDILRGQVQLMDGHRFFNEAELREAGRRIAAQPWVTKIADQDYPVLRSEVMGVRQEGPLGVVVELKGDHPLHLEGMPASSFMLWWQADPQEKSVGDKPGHDFHGNQWTQQNAQPDVPAGVLKYIGLLADQTPKESRFELMSVLDVLSEYTNQGFDDDDNDALSDYCDVGFHEINQCLRNGDEPSFEAFHFTPYNLEKLDGLFQKVRPLGAPTTLYRSVDPDTVDRLKPGDVFEDKGFTSTSFRMKEALAFHETPPRAIVLVQTSAKTKAVVVSETSEYEAVLRRGSRFRVLSVDGEVDPNEYYTQAEKDNSPWDKPKRRMLKVEVLDD